MVQLRSDFDPGAADFLGIESMGRCGANTKSRPYRWNPPGMDENWIKPTHGVSIELPMIFFRHFVCHGDPWRQFFVFFPGASIRDDPEVYAPGAL